MLFSIDHAMANKKDMVKPINLIGEELDSPWGMCTDFEHLYIANLGNKNKQPPFLCRISKDNKNNYLSERYLTYENSYQGSGFTQVRYFK